MARTVADYLSRLKSLTGRTNTQFDSLINEWLNNLFEKVETSPDKLWFLDVTVRFNTQTSAKRYDLPENFDHPYSIHIVDTSAGSYTPVELVSDEEAKKDYGPGESGEPEKFSIDGESLSFWPTPDAAYTMEMKYRKTLTRVTASTDENDFMNAYHAVIMDGLQALAWEYLEQLDRAAYYWKKWERGWVDMKASNIARVLATDIYLAPRADSRGAVSDVRGADNTFGGSYL